MKLNNLNDLMKASFKVRDGVRDGSYEIPTKEMRIFGGLYAIKGNRICFVHRKEIYVCPRTEMAKKILVKARFGETKSLYVPFFGGRKPQRKKDREKWESICSAFKEA